MGIYIIKSRDARGSTEDIRIVLEGQRVLQDLDNYTLAAAMLFGLMYTDEPDLPTGTEVYLRGITETGYGARKEQPFKEGPGSQEQTVRLNSLPVVMWEQHVYLFEYVQSFLLSQHW